MNGSERNKQIVEKVIDNELEPREYKCYTSDNSFYVNCPSSKRHIQSAVYRQYLVQCVLYLIFQNSTISYFLEVDNFELYRYK